MNNVVKKHGFTIFSGQLLFIAATLLVLSVFSEIRSYLVSKTNKQNQIPDTFSFLALWLTLWLVPLNQSWKVKITPRMTYVVDDTGS